MQQVDDHLRFDDVPEGTGGQRFLNKTRVIVNGLRLVVGSEALIMPGGKAQAPERRPIGSKFVGHDPARREAQPLQQPSHDLRWGFGVSFGLEEEVENFTFIVDGAPEPVAPASVYDGHLIEMPVVAGRRPLASGVGNDDGFEL